MKTFIIAALSADGFIAKNSNHAATWTSKEDKQFFLTATKRAGVVVMGSTTFKTIGKPLKDRLNIVYSRKPQHYEGVEFTNQDPRDLLEDLRLRGYSEAAVIGGAQIYTMFMEAGCVTTMYLTIEPVLFGKGISLFTKKLERALTLHRNQQLGQGSLLLEYSISALNA